MKMTTTRRSALLFGATLPMTGFLPLGAAAQSAGATAPPGPGRVTLGEMTLIPISAGRGKMEKPIDTYALDVDPDVFGTVCEENFLPVDWAGNSYTPTLMRMGDNTVLFDAGLKPEDTVAALAAVGVKPEDISHVILTHMHGDHIGGLYGDGPTFPNAKLIAPRLENEYWEGQNSDAYKAKVAPLIEKATLIEDGDEVLPGVKAEGAYGHTPGHTTYLLTSGDQKLLLTGDSFNHYAFSVQHPDWKVRFDVDKDKGIEARTKVLERLATDRIPFIGYHMPFPATGFIARNGENSYRFVPATYQFVG